jgi:uncharacterized membrane protein
VVLAGTSSALLHAAYFRSILFTDQWAELAYSDILSMRGVAHIPGLPYLDYQMEYPVLTGLFIRLMGVLGPGNWQYYALTCGCLIVFAALATCFLYHTVGDTGRRRLLSCWILAPSMFVFLIYNWDIMAVLCVTAALYLTARNRDCLASVALAVGFSCKLYPVLFLVPLLMKRRTAADRAKLIGAFGATALAINLFFMVSNFHGWYYFFSFNSTRPPNQDSIWGVAQYWIGPLSTSQVNILSLVLFAVGSATVVWRFRHESTARLCLALTLVFLLTNKVFSPQYALWLLPFFVLLPDLGTGAGRRLFYAFELSNLAVLLCFLGYWGPARQTEALFYAFQFLTVVRHIVLVCILATVAAHSKQDAAIGPARRCLPEASLRQSKSGAA